MAAPRRKGRRERHACGRDTPVFQTSLDKTFVHFWTTLSVNSGQKIPSLTQELFPLPGDQAGDQDDGDALPRQGVHLQQLRQAQQSRGSPGGPDWLRPRLCRNDGAPHSPWTDQAESSGLLQDGRSDRDFPGGIQRCLDRAPASQSPSAPAS